MPENSQLTICSVYHSPETAQLLELNYDLTKKLNPDAEFRWVASNGTELGENSTIDTKKFNVVEGLHSKNLPEAISSNPVYMRHIHSCLHAGSLHKTFPEIKTRFALFLDDDFMIIRKNWINGILKYMKENRLAFFGSPFHPQRYHKYRYFPCAQCIFVDLEKIKLRDIDFMPKYGLENRFFEKAKKKVFTKIVGKDRYRIGTSLDTCCGVYMRHGASSKHEVLTPVLDPKEDIKNQGMDFLPARASTDYNMRLEKFLPERFCYLPKRKGAYSAVSFKKLGSYDIKGIGAEEYLWKGLPFGFHLQGVAKRFRRGQLDPDAVFSELRTVVERFT